MAAKNAAKPRPNKNSDGMPKQPSMTHTINIDPAKPQPAPTPPPTPGAPLPGAVNPMTHPAHPAMQSSLGTAAAAAAGPKISGVQPITGNTNPTGNPLGQLTPEPTQDQRQVREQIQFKDMNPAEQSQVATQQGLDPYAPLKMVQQGVEGALQQGASSGPVPNMLAGPYVPPGVESFPDDFAHLSTLMGQGFAPGASPQEHEFAQNAHSLAHAKIQQAMQQGQEGAGAPTPDPYAAAQPGAPTGVTYAPGIPEGQNGAPQAGQPPSAPPGMPTSLGSPGPAAPPMAPPGAAGPPPGGAIPPQLIAALLAKAKQNRPVR